MRRLGPSLGRIVTFETTGMLSDDLIFSLWRARALLRHPVLHWKYARRMKRIPDTALPKTYSERMLWRKLFDRNPLFVTFADKLATKAWIAARCPDLAVPQTLWTGRVPEEIPQSLLRPGVVLKANHGSNFNMILRDDVPPRGTIVETARRWLRTRWGFRRGEWHYGCVEPTLFIEELIRPKFGPLLDISISAGSGRPMICSMIQNNKTTDQALTRISLEGRRIEHTVPGFRHLSSDVAVPEGFFAAMAHAKDLSSAVDFARFDFLVDGPRVWAGEITVFPSAGYADVRPEELALVNDVWDLRNSWFFTRDADKNDWLTNAYVRRFASATA